MTVALKPSPTEALLAHIREAVALGDPQAITARIQAELEETLRAGALPLPERFRKIGEGAYARRLFHRDEELDWTAVMMTWGPGQFTPLHDHDGCWCVEGVVEGEIRVTLYEMMEEVEPGLLRFEERTTLQASPGEAGALIPPYEYHVLGNPSPDRVAVTLHVYEGKMSRCAVFEPEQEASLPGCYRQHYKLLGYEG
jgi:3-mercaptopropionate dioxygenase